MGLGSDLCTQTGTGQPLGTGRPVARGLPDVRWSPDFHYFRSVKVTPDVRWPRTSANFGSVGVVPDVRSWPVVRWLEGVAGHPVLAGCLLAVACVGWDLGRLAFKWWTSGPDWSFGGCRFSGIFFS